MGIVEASKEKSENGYLDSSWAELYDSCVFFHQMDIEGCKTQLESHRFIE